MKNLSLLLLALLSSWSIAFSQNQTVCQNGSDSLGIEIQVLANASCAGSCDGFAYAQAYNGSGNYVYSWTGPNGYVATQSTVSALCAGTYMVIVTDVITGTSCTLTASISEPSPINLITTTQAETCTGACDGIMIVGATGGVPSYLYSIDNGNNWSTNQTYINLCAGTYPITVLDANGCQHSDVFVVNSNGVFITNVNTTDETSSSSNGSVEIISNGGVPPYTYTLNGTSQSANTFSGLSAGTYYACVTDDLGCEICDSVYIGIDSTGTNCNCQIYVMGGNPTCAGSYDGYAYVTSNGNIVSYQWSNGMTVPTLSGLCAGTYCVIATDVNGCQVDTCITLVDPAPITISINSIPASSQGANDGTMIVLASGGTPDYSYSLGGGTYTPYTQTWTFSGLSVGWHYLCAQDSMGCETCDSVYMDYSNSIGDINSDWAFDVYPNPSDDVINIKLPSVSNTDIIQLMDARGRILFRDNLQSDVETISLARYAAERGIYVVTIIHDGSTYHKKIVYQ